MDWMVLADIHDNYRALDACLAEMRRRGIQRVFLLGDDISDGAYPERVLQRLYDLCDCADCVCLRGNREQYMLAHDRGASDGWVGAAEGKRACLLYTYLRLTHRDIAFFDGLPHTVRVCPDGLPPLRLCHGSPGDVSEPLWFDSPDTAQRVLDADADMVLCAHTHIQGCRVYGAKTLLNPGSVGLPCGVGAMAQCMILHGEHGVWTPEFLNLPYDWRAAVHDLSDAGLTSLGGEWTAMVARAIETGEAQRRALGHT